MPKNKKEIKKNIDNIVDSIDLETINAVIKSSTTISNDFIITPKTLKNIAEWALDGKSQWEIAHNLELSDSEWQYLIQICPAIILVMQHSKSYADVVVAGTLFQTAIGGKKIHHREPMKVKDYENGRCVGEHYEIVEWDTESEPNPLLLKYLAEHKLSENFGEAKQSDATEHREVIDNLTEEELQAIREYSKK